MPKTIKDDNVMDPVEAKPFSVKPVNMMPAARQQVMSPSAPQPQVMDAPKPDMMQLADLMPPEMAAQQSMQSAPAIPESQGLEKGFRPESADMSMQAEQQPGGAAANGISTINSLSQGTIGEQQIIEAEMMLMKYKAGKHHLESRLIHDQQWWKLRNW